jgi:hypothetical protein
MICPCKDCQERYEACHDHCERYKAWKAPKLEAYKERAVLASEYSPAKERWLRRNLMIRKRNGR